MPLEKRCLESELVHKNAHRTTFYSTLKNKVSLTPLIKMDDLKINASGYLSNAMLQVFTHLIKTKQLEKSDLSP